MNDNNTTMSEKELEEKINFLSSAKCNHTQHIYIDITEDLVQGTLLARILYWFSPDKDNKSKVRIFKDGYFWIAKQRKDWWEEIRITERQYDKAIKELERKGFVVLAKYKFDSMPTIHIRPEYEKINSATEKWKNELKKEIIEENERDLHKSKNGNDTKCNSLGNNTKCKTGITQSGNLLTYITNTDYNNTDYRTENTDMYAFSEDKSSSKDGIYASKHVGSQIEKPNRYIPQNYSYSQLREHIRPVYSNRLKSEYAFDDSDTPIESILNITIEFCKMYEQEIGEKHPVLSDRAYENIIDNFMNPPDIMNDEGCLFSGTEGCLFSEECYMVMSEQYFKTEYNRRGKYKGKIQKSFPHFMSSVVRENLFYRTCY